MGNLPDIFSYACQNFSIDTYLDTTVSLVEFPTSFSFLYYSILIDGSPHLGLLQGQQFQGSCNFISYNLKYHLQSIYLVEHGNGSPVSPNPVLCLCGQTIILDYLLEGALIFAPILFSS